MTDESNIGGANVAEQKWLNADKALILFAMGLSNAIITNDLSVIKVALPAIEKEDECAFLI